jgi:hypothetical protein
MNEYFPQNYKVCSMKQVVREYFALVSTKNNSVASQGKLFIGT